MKKTRTDCKFEEKAIKTIFIGNTATGYLLWHPQTRRFLESREVDFNNKKVYGDLPELLKLEAKDNLDKKTTEKREKKETKEPEKCVELEVTEPKHTETYQPLFESTTRKSNLVSQERNKELEKYIKEKETQGKELDKPQEQPFRRSKKIIKKVNHSSF